MEAAEHAAEREIPRHGLPPVFDGNDVVDLVSNQGYLIGN